MKLFILRHSTFNIRYSAVLCYLSSVICILTSDLCPLSSVLLERCSGRHRFFQSCQGGAGIVNCGKQHSVGHDSHEFGRL